MIGSMKGVPLWLMAGRHRLGVGIAVVLLVGCAGERKPAEIEIGDIEAVVISSSSDTAKYVPDQLADVQSRLEELKAWFDKKDYAAVLQRAPAVMSAAQGLAGAAAAKKDELMKARNEQWSGWAATLPGYITAIQSRLDLIGRKPAKSSHAGSAARDLDAARASLRNARSLWSKAQAAFATGNLDEAVAAGKTVEVHLEGLATTLEVDLTATAATR